MAEYGDVMKEFDRMCRHHQRKLECPMGCPMDGVNISQCRKIAFERPAHFESVVAQWAAEHPEPVYPTWWKYMCMIGVIPDELGDKTLGEMIVYNLMNTCIQSDIAQKLGIEPKHE